MEGAYDSITSEDLVNAADNAEHAWSAAALASLDNLVINPSTSRDNSCKKSMVRNLKKQHKPANTSPPPRALRIEISQLDERIDSLQHKALIGKWHFPRMSDIDMRKWLANFWKLVIDYVPVISSLMRDWYCFHFLNADDAEIIQSRPWVFKRSFLTLYKWYIGFNPLKNTPVNNLIWVKCLNLPLELWSNESLEMIGNAIGRFVYVDP